MKKILLTLILCLAISNAFGSTTVFVDVTTKIKKQTHSKEFEPVLIMLKKSEETTFTFENMQLRIVIEPSIKSVIYLNPENNEMVEKTDSNHENLICIDTSRIFKFKIYLAENGFEKVIGGDPLVLCLPCTIKVPYKDFEIEFNFAEAYPYYGGLLYYREYFFQ